MLMGKGKHLVPMHQNVIAMILGMNFDADGLGLLQHFCRLVKGLRLPGVHDHPLIDPRGGTCDIVEISVFFWDPVSRGDRCIGGEAGASDADGIVFLPQIFQSDGVGQTVALPGNGLIIPGDTVIKMAVNVDGSIPQKLLNSLHEDNLPYMLSNSRKS